MKIPIYGLEKFSLVEWPGKISGIVFTGGCNFRCPFCHNPELVEIKKLKELDQYPWEVIDKFLKEKKGWLDAIIVTGGEPTLHKDLPDFLALIKERGFLSALETNGTNPEMLKKLIEAKLLDRIQMDIKNGFKKYASTVGLSEVDLEKIKASIQIIKNSGLDYEFRTTLVPGLVEEVDMTSIGEAVKGAEKIVLQQFRPIKTFDKNYEKALPYSQARIVEMSNILKEYVKKVSLND